MRVWDTRMEEMGCTDRCVVLVPGGSAAEAKQSRRWTAASWYLGCGSAPFSSLAPRVLYRSCIPLVALLRLFALTLAFCQSDPSLALGGFFL